MFFSFLLPILFFFFFIFSLLFICPSLKEEEKKNQMKGERGTLLCITSHTQKTKRSPVESKGAEGSRKKIHIKKRKKTRTRSRFLYNTRAIR